MIIRPAEDRDNEKLLAIERNAPQGDTIKLLSERKSYFVRADKFAESILMVAEDESTGDILGVMGVGVVEVMIGGQSYRGGLIFDWRSNSAVQKGLPRHMFRLWQMIRKKVAEEKLQFLFGYVKEDNPRSLGISQRSGARITGERFFLTIPVHKRFGSKGADLASWEPSFDGASDRLVVQEAYGKRDLFPLNNSKGAAQIKQYQKYIFGRVVAGDASLKIFDSTANYTQRVLEIPWFFKVARPIFKVCSAIIALPRIPNIGEEVRYWYLYDVVVNCQDDVDRLLERTRQLALENNIDYLVVCSNPHEEHYSWVAKYAWVKLKYYFLFQPLGDVPYPSEPTYFDVSYI